jgi:hypothetical protein
VRLQPGEESLAKAALSEESRTLVFNEALGRLLSVEDAAYAALFGVTDFSGVLDEADPDDIEDTRFVSDDTHRGDARVNGSGNSVASKLTGGALDDADINLPGTKLQRQLPVPSTGLITWTRESGLTDRLANFLDT